MFPADFPHDYALISVSPLFTNIRRGDELLLSGDGLNLYGPADPRGKVSLHCAVMESDSDHRELAAKIDDALSTTAFDLLADVAQRTSWKARVITTVLRYAFEKVLYFLKCDGDDVIGTFHYSSTLRAERGGYCVGTFEQSNRYFDAEIEAIQSLRPAPEMVAEEYPNE